jgi:hypothetical protein
MGKFAGAADAEMTKLTRKVPIIVQAADVLRRARKMPAGPTKNDLRQLARGLIKMHKAGIRADVQVLEPETKH